MAGMANILVGWELGSERGHAALLDPVVEALQARNHNVILAVKDPAALTRLAGAGGPWVCQAPEWPPPVPELAAPVSQTIADDLVEAGLSREADLLERAVGWVDLIEKYEVDLVLAECAPTLLLAARTRCPAVAFGTAYALPPAGRDLPVVLDNQRTPAARSLANEAALVHAFDQVNRALGGRGIGRFSDLFAVPVWACNLPELDPYASLRPEPAAGPLRLPVIDLAMLERRAFTDAGERVFVYIKPMPALPALMDALAARCRQLEVFIPNLPAAVDNPWRHVTLHREPLDLPRRLPEFSAVVHFGGMNLTAESLFAGVPQLILPQHLEQAATALAVQRLGLGHSRLNVPREPERETERQIVVTGLVQDFFADPGLLRRATEFGARLRADRRASLPGLMSLCEELLSRTAP